MFNRIVIKSILFTVFFASCLTGQEKYWKELDPGLSTGEFESPRKSTVGDSKIIILKIKPSVYSLKLFCAGELNHANLTVREWCEKYKLVGAINAGMFQADYKSNVGYMKNYDYMNNPKINKYFSVAAFNPINPEKNASFYIFDIDETNMQGIIKSYHTVIQNLRLMKRPATNRWSQQEKKWSEAALGQDKNGNILFIFSRSPYSMHDLNNILKQIPIGIDCAQHLEGGPEASLYFCYNDFTIEKAGSYETDFFERDDNDRFWPIPNVIGIVKR
ncbi:phosphodiester glycosidase family protein [candidate division KSB1 bacterium]|nr:phosphodiester glycosidase family protein [candidate division KSB1 bacterium]